MAVQEDPETQTPNIEPTEQTALLGDHESGHESEAASEDEPKPEGRRASWYLWRLFWVVVTAVTLGVFIKGWVDAGGDVEVRFHLQYDD